MRIIAMRHMIFRSTRVRATLKSVVRTLLVIAGGAIGPQASWRTRTMPYNVTGTGCAHGKIIVIGEHTVVHGLPAIAVPLPNHIVEAATGTADVRMPDASDEECGTFDDQFTCTADAAAWKTAPAAAAAAALRLWGPPHEKVSVHIRSWIPPARGLGASAAATAATVRALAEMHDVPLSDCALYELVQTGEHVAHGRASGVDAVAVTATGPVRFSVGVVQPVVTSMKAVIVVADSGLRGSTRQAVDTVSATLHQDNANNGRLLDKAAEIIEPAIAELSAGRAVALGRRMSDFHGLLKQLGASTPGLDRLAAAAVHAGAYGAKLTGGGLGGCVIALSDIGASASVRRALHAAGARRTWVVPMKERP